MALQNIVRVLVSASENWMYLYICKHELSAFPLKITTSLDMPTVKEIEEYSDAYAGLILFSNKHLLSSLFNN